MEMNGSIRLGNKRKISDHHPELHEIVVHIDRPNLLSNPFIVNESTCRATSLLAFHADFGTEMERRKGQRYDEVCRIVKLLQRGQDVILMCWCYPLPCHGQTIKQWIEKFLNENPDHLQR